MKTKSLCLLGTLIILFSLIPLCASLVSGADLSAKYKKWLEEEVPYIISSSEKDVFLGLQTDKEREFFIESFWKHRDPVPATPENEYKAEHYRRLEYANNKFGIASLPGWKTGPGRNYIILGSADTVITFDIKLRFFEGMREGTPEPPQVVSSSYLQPTVVASILSRFTLEEEQRQIKKIFNLKGVKLLTESDLRLSPPKKEQMVMKFDGKEYQVMLDATGYQKQQFGIEVSEKKAGEKESLLDTEIILPEKNIAVFGFEESQGKPYFLSFHVAKKSVAPGAEITLSKQETDEFSRGAVKAEGNIAPPKVIKIVDPVYPEEARKKKVEGVVILGIRTDIEGRVEAIKVLKSIPELDKAAIDAVRQWTYEPVIIDGEAKPVVFTITVRFKLKKEKEKAGAGEVTGEVMGGIVSDETDEEFARGAVKCVGDIAPPKRLKSVDPFYPEEARKDLVSGVVILSIWTDEKGLVKNIKVLKSIPILDKAAIDAVRQWVYEPLIIDGKPEPAVFTVTVNFRLK